MLTILITISLNNLIDHLKTKVNQHNRNTVKNIRKTKKTKTRYYSSPKKRKTTKMRTSNAWVTTNWLGQFFLLTSDASVPRPLRPFSPSIFHRSISRELVPVRTGDQNFPSQRWYMSTWHHRAFLGSSLPSGAAKSREQKVWLHLCSRDPSAPFGIGDPLHSGQCHVHHLCQEVGWAHLSRFFSYFA